MLLIIAIIVIFVIFLLYFESNDRKLAFALIINLPIALIGVILIIYFTSGIVNIASIIGFICLFRIATRNGILLVFRYVDLQKEGLKCYELIKSGTSYSLTPIIMTVFTTGLALLPFTLKKRGAGK